MENEHELMWTALDDIKRMAPGTKTGEIAATTLTKIKRTYGR
jgi:hypothetical protein